MSKPFKILSIDGGGIKGLYSARILQHLEEVHGGSLSDYFDLICGTSTGGLIALGLSLKKPASDIANVYEKKGKKIFPRWRRLMGTGMLRQTVFWGKYRNKALKKALIELFKETKIGESNNLLCIPTYSITDARNIVIKWDHPEGKLTRDNKISYVEAGLATSAAPTYFPLAEISELKGKQFIDGGVWSNNPCIVGLTEALQYFVGAGKEYDEIHILSISSLNHIGGTKTRKRRHRSFLGWKDELFNIILRGQSDYTDFFMKQLSKSAAIVPIKYVRIPSEDLSAEQAPCVQLDNASRGTIELIANKGKDRGLLAAKDDEIAQFFKTKKTYKTK